MTLLSLLFYPYKNKQYIDFIINNKKIKKNKIKNVLNILKINIKKKKYK